MKLYKRILLFVLVVCLILPLCACNKLKQEISQEDWNDNRQYIELSTGITMSYVEMGNPKGEVIILQHGMTDSSRAWSLSAPYFAKAGYHVYMPELRGQGKSQEANGYYTTVNYATDLEAFFDAKGIDKAILVGHSLGSFTVQNFWLLYPEKCSKIVLVSSLPLEGYQNDTLLNAYNYYIEPLADDGHPSDSFMDIWYDCSCKEDKYKDVFDTFLSNMKTEAQALSKNAWTNIFMGLYNSKIDYEHSCFNTEIPAIILHGNDDTMAVGTYQSRLCTLLGVSSDNYKNYDNVGHNIQYEIPEKFSNDVLAWLSTGTLPKD